MCKMLMWASTRTWEVAELATDLTHWVLPTSGEKTGPASLCPCHGAILLHPWWGVGPSLQIIGASCPVSIHANSLVSVSTYRQVQLSLGQWRAGWLSMALWFYHGSLGWQRPQTFICWTVGRMRSKIETSFPGNVDNWITKLLVCWIPSLRS